MKSISSEYIRVGRSEVSDDTLNGFVVYDDETVRRRIAEKDCPEMRLALSGQRWQPMPIQIRECY